MKVGRACARGALRRRAGRLAGQERVQAVGGVGLDIPSKSRSKMMAYKI